MKEKQLPEKIVLTSQQYAIRLLQMLQDFGEEFIRVDSVLLVVKMLTRHAVENAVVFATGDSYQFGAVEFDTCEDAEKFLGQLTEGVAYASYLDGVFHIYRYPYRSKAIDEWVFVGLDV